MISESEQGLYYDFMALAQLVRYEFDGQGMNYTLRVVDLIDWPAFESRVAG